METVAARSVNRFARSPERADLTAPSIWLVAGGLVLYLAIDGGGYDLVVHSQVAIVVWWVVLLGAAWGFLPVSRPGRAAWAGLALFGGFVVWIALASTWSISSERSLQALSLEAGYLGVLVLGVGLHRDRDRAVRHTMAAVGTAIVVVAAAAVASRLRPGLFPGADQTGSYLPAAAGRLAWPLNYWNALGALVALGLPLLLALATSARTLLGSAAATAGMPVLILCGYLTFSRGAALAFVVAIVAFLALAADRVPKLATGLTAAVGGAVLILGAQHRGAIENGLTNATARHQGQTLVIAVLIVCAGVALVQVGVMLAVRHCTPPRWLVPSPRQARGGLVAGIAILLVVAVAAGAPGRVSRAWQDFKHPQTAALHQRSLARFTIISGNGRYALWRAALKATRGHLLEGSGPGTFQLLWLPRASNASYAQNAHSLYLETLDDVGIVGLALLVGFCVLVVGAAAAIAVRSKHEHRTRAAGVTGALVAFLVSAAFDWIWQVPVLPVVFMLLAAAVLAPSRAPARAPSGITGVAIRAGAAIIALGSLLAISVPLATVNAVRRSQTLAAQGHLSTALSDAEAAARVEPGAASPQTQIALILEAQGDTGGALAAAHRAIADEPENWSTWLIASRLEAEGGNRAASTAAYVRARVLNPRSAIFRQ